MVFSDIAFLLIFLPLIGLGFHLLKACKLNKLQYLFLTIGSLIFYYAGGGLLVFLLILSALVNWFFGLVLAQYAKRSVLTIGIILNLTPLFIYKYLNFFVGNLSVFFAQEFSSYNLILPIGISFYTFQGISYLIDVYRKEVPALKNPLLFILYISFFPQLIAGPIVRLKEIHQQILTLKPSTSDISEGILRFTWGLSKKVLIADPVSRLADAGFAFNNGEPSLAIAWLALIAYTLQIYFDFSGYSDMAIGIGRTFGLKFPRNFFHPYSAISITDFWRRWHITLSSWFRDYLYIPLGGNRKSKTRAYLNLWIVFLVTGLWHGAAWTFIGWGALHGLYLTFERLFNKQEQINPKFRRALTLLLVMLAWVLFRASSLEQALSFYQALFNFSNIFELNLNITILQALTLQNIIPLLLGSWIFFCRGTFTYGEKFAASNSLTPKLAIMLILLPLCIFEIIAVGYRPFLYFQF